MMTRVRSTLTMNLMVMTRSITMKVTNDENNPEQKAGHLVGRCLFPMVKFLSKVILEVNSSLLVPTLRMGRDLLLTSSLHEATHIPLK